MTEATPGRARLAWLLHGALGALGVTAVVLLVRHVGLAELGVVLSSLWPWLLAALCVEGARCVADAWRAQLLYAQAGADVPLAHLVHLQVVAYPVALLVPSGGAAAEVYKAALLAPRVGAPIAVAAGVLQPGTALVGAAIVSAPCVFVAYGAWGWSGVTIAVAIQGATALGLGAAILVGARRASIQRLAARLSARTGAAVFEVQSALARVPLVPLGAVGAAALNRALQLILVGLLAWGAGATPSVRTAWLALGVQLVGQAAGDLVPAQIGATDASFALAADRLGLDPARAISIAIAGHLVQLAWAALGAAASIGARRPSRPASSSARAAR